MADDSGALRSLLALFEIRVDPDGELKRADKQVDGFKAKLEAVGKVVVEAFAIHAIEQFVESQIQAGAELKIMSERLGLTTQQLQQYQLAAGEAGVRSEGLTFGLRFLNRNIAEAASKGGEAAVAFKALGVHLKESGKVRDTSDVLIDVADGMAKIQESSKRTELAMRLFGRGGAELIPILSQGGAAFRKAREEMQALGGGMSDEFVHQAHEAEIAQVRLNFALVGLKSTVALAVLPMFMAIIDRLTRATVATKAFFHDTYALTTGLEALAVVGTLKAVTGLMQLAKTFGILKPSIVETIAALWEFAGPVLVAAALFLAFDELYTLMRGGKTVIGDTLDQLFGIGTAAKLVLFLNASFEDMIDELASAERIIYEALVAPFETAYHLIGGILKALDDLGGSADGADWGKAWKDITEGNSAASGALAKRGANIGAAWETVPMRAENIDALLRAGVRPEQALAGQLGTGTYLTQNVHTQVEVHTSSDQPKVIGDAVGQGVATHVQRANHNAKRAVKKP